MNTSRSVCLLIPLIWSAAARAQYAEPPVVRAPGTPASGEEFRLPLAEPVAAEAALLISQLGSPDYPQRERASERLQEIGASAFALLRTAYHETDDLEVRLRIERVVREAYLDHHVYRHNGFLGVSQDRIGVTSDEDPRIPAGQMGIRVRQVLENTGAERAGLQSEDVIVALNGRPLEAGAHPSERFGDTICHLGPHARVVLTLLRGQRRLEVEATLGRRPLEHYGFGQGEAYESLVQASLAFEDWWLRQFRRPAVAPEAE